MKQDYKRSFDFLFLTFILGLGVNFSIYSQGLGVNSNGNVPDPSSMLDVSSTSKGVLIPRMTTAQRNAITNAAEGLQIYNLDCHNYDYWNGSAWMPVNNIKAAVSITANPSGSICQGTNVTFTATPTLGGTSPSYQWKLNGLYVGTGATTYSSSSLNNGDVVECELTSNSPCVSLNPAVSNSIKIIYSPPPTTSGLVGYWPLEGNTNDLSGLSNNGTGTAITYVTGNFSQGVSFNGTTSFISVPDNASIDVTTATWSFWIKFATLADPPHAYAIMSKQGAVNRNGLYVIKQIGGGIDVAIFDAVGNNTGISCGNISDVSNWHHVAFTFSAGGSFSGYLDGILKSSGTCVKFYYCNNQPAYHWEEF